MNWRKSKVFSSFTIQGALIESLYKNESQQLIVYDCSNIKIYDLNEIRLFDQIRLYTQIKKIVFLSTPNSKYFIVQNEQGQISAISSQYPYEHKIIYLPENFTKDCILSESQNKSYFIVQFESDIIIFEINSRGDVISEKINIKNKEIAQIDIALNSTVNIVYYDYEALIENQFQNTCIANVETTIYSCKLHSKDKGSTYIFKFLIYQIITLEMDNLIILSQNEVQCVKNDKQQCSILLPYFGNISFMKFNSINNQLYIINKPYLEIIEIKFDAFNQFQSMNKLQSINIPINDLIVNNNWLWILTEQNGSIYQIYNQFINQDSEQIQKKMKLEDIDLYAKKINVFNTNNKIFNFTVVANQLYLLFGNAQNSKLNKIQYEIIPSITTISLKIKSTINNQSNPLFFENHIGFINNQNQLSFSKILKDGTLQLVDNILIPEYQEIFSNGTINNNCFYIQFDTYLWFIQTNPLCQFSRQYECRQIKQLSNYFIGFNEDNELQVTYLKEKSLVKEILHQQKVISFDISLNDEKLLILIVEEDKLLIYEIQLQINQIIKSVIFQTNDFKNNINALIHKSEIGSQQNIVQTCPSVQFKQQSLNQFDTIQQAYLIYFSKSKSSMIILISQNLRVTLYSLIKNLTDEMNIYKIVYSYTLNQEIKFSNKYLFSSQPNIYQYIIPSLNLFLSDNLGEIMIHFIKQEEEYQDAFIVSNNAFLLGKTGSYYQLTNLQNSELTSNNIIMQQILKNKQITILDTFQFNNYDYLLVVNKSAVRKSNSNSNALKNEIQVYKSDNLNEPFAQYDQLDNEEIIKVQFLNGMDLILVLTIVASTVKGESPNTKLHILKLDQYQKISEQQQSKLIKESVPCDFVVLPPKFVLLFLQDQLKYIDLSCGQSAINFQLTTEQQRTEFVQVNIEAVTIVDRWVAVLNGGFKITVCKFQEDNSQPKVEWATEFGVSKVIDIVLVKNNFEKPLLAILDQNYNLSIYSIAYKIKIKKIADCQIINPCRMLNISNKLIISQYDGNVIMFDQVEDENSYKQFKTVLLELPYIGGFQPTNLFFAQNKNSRGLIWDFEIKDLFNQLSLNIQNGIQQRQQIHNYD